MNPAESQSALRLSTALVLTLLVPPFISMRFGVESNAPGALLDASAWIAVALLAGLGSDSARWPWRRIGLALLGVTLLFMHGLSVDMWLGGVNFGRLLQSSAALLLQLIGACAVAAFLLAASPRVLTFAGRSAYGILTLIGIAAALGVPGVGGSFVKPVIVFSEPSLFSMAYAPTLLFALVTTTRVRQLWMLLLGLALALKLQNLTLLVDVVGAGCLVLRRGQIYILLAVVWSIASFVLLDFSYFAQRLALSADSDNLSTLVYLQGWQRAALNLRETDGLGVGFQQFGVVGSLGDVLEKIIRITGSALNLYDGGSTGSKLIGELGVVGIILMALYLRVVLRGIILLRRAQRLVSGLRDRRRLFFYSFIVAYVSELFVRGNGYLSCSDMLVMASLIAISRLDRRTAVSPDRATPLTPLSSVA